MDKNEKKPQLTEEQKLLCKMAALIAGSKTPMMLGEARGKVVVDAVKLARMILDEVVTL